MHLGPVSLEPHLLKGDTSHIVKPYLLLSKLTMFWESNLFTVLQGDEDLKEHTLKPADFICCKRYLRNNSLPPGRTGHFQVLLTNPGAAKLQRTDS